MGAGTSLRARSSGSVARKQVFEKIHRGSKPKACSRDESIRTLASGVSSFKTSERF